MAVSGFTTPTVIMEAFEAIRESDDAEAVVGVMRKHAGSAGVPTAGCMRLFSIAHFRYAEITRLVNAGAVEAVVSAMQQHPEVAGV